MATFKNYLSLIKFSHTIFALPFALIGFFLGLSKQNIESQLLNQAQEPFFSSHNMLLFLFVLGCMVTARSAAMAFNRYLDRHIDALNPRTAIREIPKGIIKPNQALFFTILSSILFVVFAALINKICFYLSPIALLVVLGYSYTKRFTPLCHLVLGIGLSLAPIGAFLAVTGVFNLLPLLFSFTVIFWVSGFDIIYALQDEDFDQSNKLYSIPAWLGKAKALRVSELLHLIAGIFVLMAGIYGNFSFIYWIGASIFSGMLIYQHSIVKPNDLSKVNIAFMTANGIASIVFASFVILDIFI
ncbi:MAG: putative 4-hydroxybenzoate polyprenyltransferase [Chitinophagaceae bacterium]|nr:putative 4-hydroxybenzoate polyprenyltransferase [Chitinophagaceae bacterium]